MQSVCTIFGVCVDVPVHKCCKFTHIPLLKESQLAMRTPDTAHCASAAAVPNSPLVEPLMQTSHCRQYCHLSSSARALVSGAAWPFTWYVSPFAATEDRSERSLFPGSCFSRLRWDALRCVSLCRTGVWTGATPARSLTQVRQVQLQLICKDSSRTHRLNSELSDTGHPANPHATIIRGLLGRRCCGPN